MLHPMRTPGFQVLVLTLTSSVVPILASAAETEEPFELAHEHTSGDVVAVQEAHHFYYVEPLTRGYARSLNAHQGVEANAVFAPTLETGAESFEWSSEIAATLVDGVSVEADVAFVDEEPHGVRTMAQLRLSEGRFTMHGLQLTEEHNLMHNADHVEFAHVMQWRLPRSWELVTMVGGGVSVSTHEEFDFTGRALASHREVAPELDAAVSTFHVNRDGIAVGIEVRERLIAGTDLRLLAVPEAHVQLGQHAQWASGVGAEFDGRTIWPVLATRLIVESSH